MASNSTAEIASVLARGSYASGNEYHRGGPNELAIMVVPSEPNISIPYDSCLRQEKVVPVRGGDNSVLLGG